jgi:hypothetical protein
MSVLFRSIAVAVVGICLAGPTNAALYVLSGDIDVFQALTNPANVGSGTGTISGDYDDATNILDYSIEWMDLTTPVNNMHFHLGAPGTSGGVDLGIPSPWISPQLGVDILLNNSQEANLLSGDWYVNVHTVNFGGGEIRGQVLVNAVPIPAAIWLFGTALIGFVGISRRRKVA